MISIDYPFAGRFRVSQDAQGQFSHDSGFGAAAYDFSMPLQTEVRSVDPGKVIGVYESVDSTGNFLGNYVTIKHFADDKVVYFATYLHLVVNGVIPERGDTVTTGQVIGLSGNTGFSTGPHLHFQFSTTTFRHSTGIVADATNTHDFLIDFNGNTPSTGQTVKGKVRPDFADTLAAADNSKIRTGSFETKNSVGFGTDTNDFVKFRFAEDGILNAQLTNLIGNLDLKLLDDNGTVIASSSTRGKANEQINNGVTAGKDYFLWIDPSGNKFSTYNIKVNVAPVIVFTNGVDVAALQVPDIYNALGGNDNVTGSNGADTINGGTGNDQLSGNDGNDILNGGAGIDTLRGNRGNDTLIVDNASDIVIEVAGQGTSDRVASSVSYALASGADIELFTTTSAGRTADLNLTGNTRSQTIIGNAGDNLLNGGGAGGSDVFRGLGGNDRFRVHNSADRILEQAGQGNDRVLTSVDYQLATAVDVEILTTSSSAGTNDLHLTGNKLSQTIIGNAGDNFISSGGAGAPDLLRGLGGNDTYRIYNAADTIIENPNSGADRVKSSIDYTLADNVSIESLATNGSTGTANISLTGNEHSQSIIGNAGSNRLDGKEGADTLRGLNGADTFIFSSVLGASNIDTIVDFNTATDQVELNSAIFTALSALGPLSADQFKSNTSGLATDATDRIIYDTDGGQLYYDPDGNGADTAQQFASLTASPNLSFDDFDIT